MIHHTLSPAATRDIAAILERSEMNFGRRASRRYEELLVRAISDIIENPHRFGCVKTPEIKEGSFTYHLKHSRRNVRREIGRVHQPRHFLLCRFTGEGVLEVSRVIHDLMQLDHHLLED